MSKIIKLTDELVNEVREDFEKLLTEGKFTDGKVSYTYSFTNLNRKATLCFSELAWLKMHALVREFSTEIAWNGIARRGENDEYYVDDIIVYPQLVTGTTVDCDKEEYAKWCMTLDDDTFKNMRMQGHSHVNMGTSPSSTDTNFYNNEILAELSDTDFYIFVIWNKKDERTIKIYDFGENILFETADVTVSVLNEGIGIEDIVLDAKSKLRNKVVTPAPVVAAATSATSYTKNKTTNETKPKKESTSKYKRKDVSSYCCYGSYDDEWDDEYNPDYSYYGYGRY